MDYEIEEKSEHRCLECGAEIIYGRQDKKFCSERCRNNYHNSETHKIRALHTRIIGILNKNYKILDTYLKVGLNSIPLSEMSMSGFNPLIFTSCEKNRNHKTFHCYEIKYSVSETRIFDIRR